MAKDALAPYHALLINEVCSTNKSSLTDANGQTPDWVELYNPTDRTISLSGFGLSDGAKNKFKFTFPEEAVIEADGYVLVYCDDALYSNADEYHAAFKISASGETIYLTHPETGEIDSADIPELTEDTTYGRYANGTEHFTYLTATPGKSNDTAKTLDLVERPVFSAEGGFYDAAFDLTLTDANGNTIYYTTDGSDPRTSDTAMVYKDAISIYNNTNDPNVWSALTDITLYDYTPPTGQVDKGIVIRAVSQNANGTFSPVTTNGYFIGKTASYYSDMKVISLSTDPDYLFDEDTGAYMVGSSYHEWVNSSAYVEYNAGDTNNPTNYNKEGRETEFPVNVQVFENGTLAYTSDVGARISGAWSRAYPQKSIRLYARSEYGDSKIKYAFIDELTDINGNLIEEFDKITIRNGGTDNQLLHMRDMLFQELCTGRSVDIQGGEPCILFIDGEFWGFYFIREKLESDYIESHYGIDKDNVTIIKNGALDEGSQALANEYNSLLRWAAEADMTDPANYQKVCDAIDIQSFMDIVTIETYINNADWATGYLNNSMLWRSNTVDESIAGADGRWRFMLYDLDFAADYFHNGTTLSGYDSLGSLYTGDDDYNMIPMFYNLLNNEEFSSAFYENYIDIMKNYLSPTIVNEKIDEYVAAYEEAFHATNVRFGSEWVNENYDEEVQNLRNFFNERFIYGKRYLDSLYGKTEARDGTGFTISASKFTYYGNASTSYDTSKNEYYITTKSTSMNEWDIQMQSPQITIENGKTYRLTFEASCDTAASIGVNINHQEGSSWPNCWSVGGIKLSSEMTAYSYVFTSSSVTASDWRLCFNLANDIGRYTIKDVCLTEIYYDDELVTELGDWMLYNPSKGSVMTVEDIHAVTVNTTALPDNTWEAQALYYGLVLEEGIRYTYSFTISASQDMKVTAHVQKNYGEYEKYSENTITATSVPKTYTYTFTAGSDCNDASICFDCGYGLGTVEITDVSVVRNG